VEGELIKDKEQGIISSDRPGDVREGSESG
jgi:hypothetical protein